jgi:vacuolar-type H+-ATPase subunit E/Vma4
MSQEIDDFLEALKDIIDSEITEIQSRAQTEIEAIKEKTKHKIATLKEEQDSLTISQSLLENFQQELSKRQLEWIKRINNEKGHYLDQLFKELRQRFKEISKGPEIYFLLNKLFTEVKNNAGNDFEVHITRNCDPNKFKEKVMTTKKVLADLDEVGIVIKRFDIPMSIANTLESRLEKSRADLVVQGSQTLWGDLDDSPWQTRQVLNQLLEK